MSVSGKNTKKMIKICETKINLIKAVQKNYKSNHYLVIEVMNENRNDFRRIGKTKKKKQNYFEKCSIANDKQLTVSERN